MSRRPIGTTSINATSYSLEDPLPPLPHEEQAYTNNNNQGVSRGKFWDWTMNGGQENCRPTPFYVLRWRALKMRFAAFKLWMDEKILSSIITSSSGNASNYYDYEEKWFWKIAQAMQVLLKTRWKLLLRIAVSLLFCTMLWIYCTSDAEAQVDDPTRHLKPSFAKESDDNVDFNRPSRRLTCAEQQSGFIENSTMTLSKILHFSEAALTGTVDRDIPPLPCSCAPLFGQNLDILSLKNINSAPEKEKTTPGENNSKNQQFIHAFHIRLDPAPGSEQVVVEENQDFLFDAERPRGTIRIKRYSNIILHYNEMKTCRQATPIQLKDQYAFCAQACLDLIQGITIDKSPNALPSFAHTIEQ